MVVGAVKYWINGLPLDGLSSSAGTVKYWFNGLPYDTLTPSVVPPTPTASNQVFIDIQTAARSFTMRKRMF